jgi:anaerobic selenocysteine-containing dehydrogenase
LASDVYQEIIPSIGDRYPYPVKALLTYMAAPTYALPAGHTNIAVLCDLEALPLHVACDVVIGPTSMYADYIFPDGCFLERWEFQGSHPNMPVKVQPVRQPVIAPIPEEVRVYGQAHPMTLEALILGIAERLDLPGFGVNGFGQGLPLRHQDDLMLRGVGNLAFGEKTDGSDAVPAASATRSMPSFRLGVICRLRSSIPRAGAPSSARSTGLRWSPC